MSFRRIVLLKSDYVVGLRSDFKLGTSYVVRIENLVISRASVGTEAEERNGDENGEER